MGNEITALKDEIEISYLFSEPGRAALYITHPSWRLNKENIINEDQRYVMGPSHFDTDYVPLPSEAFKNSMENLARREALKMSPNFSDSDISYILDPLSVFIRIRNDKKGAHTIKMVGLEKSLIILADKIGLPHPFYRKKYPYKEIFRDASGAEGKILSLI